MSISKRILVTGGAGFLGLTLVERLAGLGHRLRVLDLERPESRMIPAGVELIRADIRDRGAVEAACRCADAVVHCVAIQPISRADRRRFWAVNVGGTRNVLEAALRVGVRRVIYVSSSAPYGVPRDTPLTEESSFAPVCAYGRSKVAAEDLCRLYRALGVDVVILRPRVLVGARRLGFFHFVFEWIADGKRIYVIGSGDNPFQMLAVEDMAEACALALRADCANAEINLGTARFGTVREDLERLVAHAGSDSRITPVPARLVARVLGPLDRIGVSPFTAWHYLTADAPFHYDIDRAQRLLGWQPTKSNTEMLTASYDWYRSRRSTVDADFGTTHRRALRQRIFRLLRALS